MKSPTYRRAVCAAVPLCLYLAGDAVAQSADPTPFDAGSPTTADPRQRRMLEEMLAPFLEEVRAVAAERRA